MPFVRRRNRELEKPGRSVVNRNETGGATVTRGSNPALSASPACRTFTTDPARQGSPNRSQARASARTRVMGAGTDIVSSPDERLQRIVEP
jgi:hypothetical protein